MADERVLGEGLWQAFRSHPIGAELWREAESGAAFAARIARAAGEDPSLASLAALGRDVAKLSWPSWAFERALLPDEDRRFLEGHVVESVRLLERAAGWGEEEAVLRAVGQHHERWDGRGYPQGLRGEEATRLGRIVAVCDALAAMTEGRPWAPRRGLGAACEEVRRQAGTQFDPAVGVWLSGVAPERR